MILPPMEMGAWGDNCLKIVTNGLKLVIKLFVDTVSLQRVKKNRNDSN
jgi:hypothetical protein